MRITVRLCLLSLLGLCSVCVLAQQEGFTPSLSQSAKLTASDGTSQDQLGYAVAISGNTVVVGAQFAQIGSNVSEGAAYVFVKPASGWANMTQVAKLTASDGSANMRFGFSVAISGNTVVVGTRTGGPVYVYAMPTGGWRNMTQTAELSHPTGCPCSFGWSVAASGNVIAVGAPGFYVNYFGQGAVFVFVKPTNGWVNTSKIAAHLYESGVSTNYDLGYSVSMSGNTIVSGAILATANSNVAPGAAYLFVKPTNGWKTGTETAKLTSSDGNNGDNFGTSVAASGGTILVGAPGHHSLSLLGAAYVFVKPASGWKTATETAEVTSGSCGLGSSVAVTASEAVAGTTAGDCDALPGAAYEFSKPTTGWVNTSQYTNELTAADGFDDDEFGASVAIAQTIIVVGAPRFLFSPGAAYIF
jgi:hypothetical protein